MGSEMCIRDRCRCSTIVVDYRWGSIGSDETATATTGGPRVIGVFVTVAAGSIAVSLSRMTSNCDPEVSRRPRQVGTRRVQTPTHIPPPLPSVYTYQARCLAVRGPQAHLPKSYQSYQFWIQSSLGSTKHRCMRPRRLPETYPERAPRADLHPKKVNNLAPMAPRSRKKRQFL